MPWGSRSPSWVVWLVCCQRQTRICGRRRPDGAATPPGRRPDGIRPDGARKNPRKPGKNCLRRGTDGIRRCRDGVQTASRRCQTAPRRRPDGAQTAPRRCRLKVETARPKIPENFTKGRDGLPQLRPIIRRSSKSTPKRRLKENPSQHRPNTAPTKIGRNSVQTTSKQRLNNVTRFRSKHRPDVV